MTPRRRAAVSRGLADLEGIGPAMLGDFEKLGIRTVAQLAKRNPHAMYRRLSKITGRRQDPCVDDVFSAAVAQARDPKLPAARRKWWFWSAVRKSRAATAER